MIKAIAAAIMLIALSTCCMAEEWTQGFGQGYVEHIIRHGTGNSFDISCDEGASMKRGANTSIYIEIGGRSPPPKTAINVILDGDEFQLQTNESGNVNLDCHVCYDNYRAMWKRLRTAHSMLVQFEDHMSVKFDMKGARKVLSPEACKTPWDAQ